MLSVEKLISKILYRMIPFMKHCWNGNITEMENILMIARG